MVLTFKFTQGRDLYGLLFSWDTLKARLVLNPAPSSLQMMAAPLDNCLGDPQQDLPR